MGNDTRKVDITRSTLKLNDGRLVILPPPPVIRQSTKHIQTVTVTDPDSDLPVEVEIRKTDGGAIVGFDGSFLEQLADDEQPYSPYDANVFLVVPTDEQ